VQGLPSCRQHLVQLLNSQRAASILPQPQQRRLVDPASPCPMRGCAGTAAGLAAGTSATGMLEYAPVPVGRAAGCASCCPTDDLGAPGCAGMLKPPPYMPMRTCVASQLGVQPIRWHLTPVQHVCMITMPDSWCSTARTCWTDTSLSAASVDWSTKAGGVASCLEPKHSAVQRLVTLSDTQAARQPA
jgi:hypothetical protein